MRVRKRKGRGPIKLAIFAFLAVFLIGLGYQLKHLLYAPSHGSSGGSGSTLGVGQGVVGSDTAATKEGLATLETKLRSEIEEWAAAQAVRLCTQIRDGLKKKICAGDLNDMPS